MPRVLHVINTYYQLLRNMVELTSLSRFRLEFMSELTKSAETVCIKSEPYQVLTLVYNARISIEVMGGRDLWRAKRAEKFFLGGPRVVAPPKEKNCNDL